MQNKFNWGIIGYGNIAKNFRKNILEKKNNTLKGISSRTKKIDNIDNVTIYKDETDLLSDKNIDSIYISNLNNQHFKTAKNCLKNNKNFIIEKPSFIDEEEGNIFIEELKYSNSFVMEGYMNIYHPQIDLVKNLIQDNEIGDIQKIEINIGFNILKKFLIFEYYKYNKTHRLLDKNKGGGAIFDIGCYGISISRKIIKDMCKEEDNFKLTNISGKIGSTKVDEHAFVTLLFSNGITSNIKCSIVENLENTINIFGSCGEIKILEPWTPTYTAKINLINNKGKKIIKTGTMQSAYWYEIDFYNKAIESNLEIKKQIKKNQIIDIQKNTLAITNWSEKLKKSFS